MGVPLCVFAKPPVPGRVKTRLSGWLGEVAAAELAAAMLDDTLARVARCGRVSPYVASTGPITVDVPVLAQGGGDLGARIMRVLRRGVEIGRAGAGNPPLGVIAIGADSPTLPIETIEAACDALAAGCDAMAMAADGGFVLLAVRQVPLLTDLVWSSPSTGAAVWARLSSPVALRPWWDVDEPADVAKLLESPGPSVAAWAARWRGSIAGL